MVSVWVCAKREDPVCMGWYRQKTERGGRKQGMPFVSLLRSLEWKLLLWQQECFCFSLSLSPSFSSEWPEYLGYSLSCHLPSQSKLYISSLYFTEILFIVFYPTHAHIQICNGHSNVHKCSYIYMNTYCRNCSVAAATSHTVNHKNN